MGFQVSDMISYWDGILGMKVDDTMIKRRNYLKHNLAIIKVIIIINILGCLDCEAMI